MTHDGYRQFRCRFLTFWLISSRYRVSCLVKLINRRIAISLTLFAFNLFGITMNSAPFSPEALGTLAALASGVVALGTAVYRGMNANDAPVPANGTVPVPAPVVPVGVNQL